MAGRLLDDVSVGEVARVRVVPIVMSAIVVVGLVGCGSSGHGREAGQSSNAATSTAATVKNGRTSPWPAASKDQCESETCFYLGNREVGYIYDASIFDCQAYAAGYVTGGRRSLAVHTHTSTEGYAVLRPSGRWDIYARAYTVRAGFFWKHVGFAVRRTRARWDVLRFGPGGPHVVGHTIGAKGPAAATLLLTICW